MKESAELSGENIRERSFTLGIDAGLVGRWARLILGSLLPLSSIIRVLIIEQQSISFLLMTAIYFAIIFGVYLAAHSFLGETLLARINPWIGTLILVGPPTAALALSLGPAEFQLALALYIAISLSFNFVMSYGGCEVMAMPSLIFRKRYVVYCPWDVVDVIDKVIDERSASRNE
jgi:hypothetical protein